MGDGAAVPFRTSLTIATPRKEHSCREPPESDASVEDQQAGLLVIARSMRRRQRAEAFGLRSVRSSGPGANYRRITPALRAKRQGKRLAPPNRPRPRCHEPGSPPGIALDWWIDRLPAAVPAPTSPIYHSCGSRRDCRYSRQAARMSVARRQRLRADACFVCGAPVDLECSGDDRWVWVGTVGRVADQQDARCLDEQDVSDGNRPLGRKPLRRRELLDREAPDRAVLSNVLRELGLLLALGRGRRGEGDHPRHAPRAIGARGVLGQRRAETLSTQALGVRRCFGISFRPRGRAAVEGRRAARGVPSLFARPHDVPFSAADSARCARDSDAPPHPASVTESATAATATPLATTARPEPVSPSPEPQYFGRHALRPRSSHSDATSVNGDVTRCCSRVNSTLCGDLG